MSKSHLLSPIFASAAVSELFSDAAMLQAMLDFEAALAEAEAEAGVIPPTSVGPIRSAADVSLYEIAEIGRGAALAGNVAIPLVKALTAKVNERARGHVHWGATSQDVIDTAFMLCAAKALPLIRADLIAAMDALAALAARHRETLMPGRTLMQQALPVSFGYKAAIWLSGLTAAAARLRTVEQRALALQFGGAAGTLAALLDQGPAVRKALAGKLQLSESPVTWHAERSRLFDLAAALAALSGAASKVAADVILMMQTEVAEVFEPAVSGKGGSSTMPQKRNPVGSIAIRANHRRIVGLLGTIALSLEVEHERAAGGWAAEWETMRDLFSLAAGSAETLRDTLQGLEIDSKRMRDNLEVTLGLPLAESLMMVLAAKIGRAEAKHRIEAASKLALASGRALSEIVKGEPAISGNLSSEEVDRALDPRHYLGSVDTMIDAAIEAARRESEAR